MAVLLHYNSTDSISVQQLHESTQIKLVRVCKQCNDSKTLFHCTLVHLILDFYGVFVVVVFLGDAATGPADSPQVQVVGER